MPLKKQFKITQTLHENNHTIVHRAIRLSDKKRVILKLIRPSSRDEKTLTQFVNEQKVLSSLRSKNIIRLLDVIATSTEYTHVLEDIEGTSLYDFLLKEKPTIQDTLEIALNVAKALESVHKSKVIHADISPKNIIYNAKTRAIQLIDFGYALPIEHLKTFDTTQTVSSGNLLYMSPEQTGLTNEPLDLRSDLYSFGMTLYHLFLGYIPFNSTDRYELVHKQIALNPTPLHELDRNIPAVVSKIVQKLIHKSPQDRYQNDEALIYDIKKAIRHTDASGKISDFQIATHNRPLLHMGNQLFGREDERKVLTEISQKISSNIPVKGVVSGQPGVGKTRLIEELFHLIPQNSVKVLRGKFDQHYMHIPYMSFKQIFLQLHTLLMSQHTYDLSALSTRSVSLLHSIFPDLATVLPKRSHAYSSVTEDIITQLPKAVKELFESIATQEQPFIVFLDDLQWADQASLELLKNSILDMNSPHLHFIGAYRENEIAANEDAVNLVQSVLKEKKPFIFQIKLQPLHKKNLQNMLTTLLSSKSKKIKELAETIYHKTGGNPFYVKTLINTLVDINELYFDKGKWDYNTQKVNTYSASINIAQLINTKFTKLTKAKQEYLFYLALLGNRFELELTLDMMNTFGFDNENIQEIQNDGFIYLNMNQYQFVHDLIQENIYSFITPEKKRQVHKKIGKYLQHAYERQEFDDVITLVEHLNNAYEEGHFPKYLFKLNILALEDTLLKSAYQLALIKTNWIYEHLFNTDLWESNRREVFTYKTLMIKTLYLNALHEQAKKEVEKLIKQTNNTQEKLICFSLYKNICVTQGKEFESLLEFGNALLIELGLKVPKNTKELKSVLKNLQNKIAHHRLFEHPSEIIHQPQRYKGKQKSVSALLMEYWEAAFYLADIELMQWAYLNIVYSSFRHGNTSESSFGYVLYGAQLVTDKAYKKSQLFGQAALKLNHRFNDLNMLPKINNFVANFINPYTRPLLSNVPIYQESLHHSKLNGDIVFGTWANFLMHFSYFLSGRPLEEVNAKISHESEFIRNSGDTKMIAIFDILVRTINTMQEFDTITIFDEESALKLWQENNFYPALAWYALIQAQECFLKASFDEGLKFFEEHVNTVSNEVIMFPKLRLHFMRALLALGKRMPLSSKQKKTLQSDLDEFDSYAKSAPSNFKFEKLLLQAEQMKSSASAWDVVKVYDKSLQEARRLQNPFFLALGGLCAGRFWKALNYNDLSDFYFNEAIVGLNQWGAFALVKHLKSTVFIQDFTQHDSSSHSSSIPQLSDNNLQSLLTAFNTISKASDTKELVHKLMQIILQNATASKAVLLLKQGENFLVHASIDFQKKKIYDYRISVDDSSFIPRNIITYTINTGEKIELQNPFENGKFQFDEYIQEHRPASCLCLPSSLEGSTRGVLYLENKEVHTPLADETIKTLELLLSQTVILYQNTALYETLKISEDNLNKAQEISHVGSWQFNSKTQKIIWSAETYRIYELEPFSLDIDGEWFFSHLHPDDLEYVMQAAEKALEGTREYNIIHRIVIPNGKEKIIHQRAERFIDEEGVAILSGTIQDITDTERTKELVSRLSQVVDQNPFSTFITDTDGFIIYSNKKAVEMTGYTHHELLNKKMSIFRSYSHSETFYNDLWKTIKDDQSIWRGTLINKMKDGELLDCESTIFPVFDDHGNIMNFVTIQEDATQRNIKEKLFLMQTRHAQMGEMISMIAHQWRQPLAIMTALMNKQRVDLVLDKADEEDIIETYDQLETQIKHLSSTITDFRDFFKPDKKPVMTTSSDIVSKSYTLIEHAFYQQGIHVDFHYLSDEKYITFEREMEQVILNLFKNAQDAFTERQIEKPHITIACDSKDGYASISVEDNAEGINPNIIETLFLPYISTKDQKQGTGLGLYMSKTIVEEHCKGSLSVHNTEHGACFTIKIPMRENYESK